MYTYLDYPYIKDIQSDYLSNINTFIGITEIVEFPDSLKKFIDYYNIQDNISRVDMLVVNSFTETNYAHIDQGDFRYSLNIPIANYENSKTCFFKPNTKLIIADADFVNDSDNKKTKGKYFRFQITEKSELLGEYPTKGIFLMDTRIPHSISNPNSTTRYTLLLRLKNSFVPWHKQ